MTLRSLLLSTRHAFLKHLLPLLFVSQFYLEVQQFLLLYNKDCRQFCRFCAFLNPFYLFTLQNSKLQDVLENLNILCELLMG